VVVRVPDVPGSVVEFDRRLERGTPGARGREVVPDGGIEEDDAGAGVVEAVGERVPAEQRRQRHGDGAEQPAGGVGDGRLEALGGDDAHPVARDDAERRERRGHAPGRVGDVFERVRRSRRGVGERDALVGVGVAVFLQAVDGGIVAPGQVPLELVAGRLVAVVVGHHPPGHDAPFGSPRFVGSGWRKVTTKPRSTAP